MLCKNLKRAIKRSSKLLTLDFNKYNIVKAKRKLFFAFTMAEAVLVMTILGIIATIMITTLKPAEFKDKGLRVLADKVLGEIDTATTQILLNDSRDGTMENLIAVDGTNFGAGNTIGGNNIPAKSTKLAGLYKKYLSATRKECNNKNCVCYAFSEDLINEYTADHFNFFYLKDGACMGVVTRNDYIDTSYKYLFPGEDADEIGNQKVKGVSIQIVFDINGDNEPNTWGKDKFIIPVSKYGIIYDE